MTNARFCGGIRIRGVAEPRAFVDETFETASPLKLKFVDVVGAHLIDDQEDYELGALRWRGSCRRSRAVDDGHRLLLGLGRGGQDRKER